MKINFYETLKSDEAPDQNIEDENEQTNLYDTLEWDESNIE